MHASMKVNYTQIKYYKSKISQRKQSKYTVINYLPYKGAQYSASVPLLYRATSQIRQATLDYLNIDRKISRIATRPGDR